MENLIFFFISADQPSSISLGPVPYRITLFHTSFPSSLRFTILRSSFYNHTDEHWTVFHYSSLSNHRLTTFHPFFVWSSSIPPASHPTDQQSSITPASLTTGWQSSIHSLYGYLPPLASHPTDQQSSIPPFSHPSVPPPSISYSYNRPSSYPTYSFSFIHPSSQAQISTLFHSAFLSSHRSTLFHSSSRPLF